MTRKEFIKKYKNDCRYYFDGYYRDCIDDFLTNIYNDHEAQLKVKDKRIAELEAMKTKTCEWCKHSKVTISSVICGKNGTYKEADDYCKYFMPKGNA